MSTEEFTPQSSVTAHHRESLEHEIVEEEKRIEEYGGDDIHGPGYYQRGAAPVEPKPVTWDGPNDPSNPQNWSYGYKWIVTILCTIMTVNVTFASSAPTSAVFAIKEQFGVSTEVAYLTTTVFLLGYVFGPLFWGPGSELIGRRPIFIISLATYTLFHLGQALATNIQTFLITRYFSGFFAVAPLTIFGGVIADIWSAEVRGKASSLFASSVFLGPVLGPIVGGYVIQSGTDWTWIIWVMMIFAGVCTIIAILAVPETYAPVILAKKARKIRKEDPSSTVFSEHDQKDWSIRSLIERTIFRPFVMLAKEPILILITIYLSLVYGILYALFEAFPIIFIEKRGLSIGQNGLTFIGVGIGTTLGAFVNLALISHYPKLIKTWKGFPPPEQRLFGAMVAGPSLVIGIFWLGWAGEYEHVKWFVPAISGIFLGLSISLIFMSFLSYLIDTYLMYSASAFAANTAIRSATAAAFPLFTNQMFTNLGVNWAATLLGLIALVLSPMPFLFYKYGPRIRTKSKFAPCIDLKIAKELEREKENQDNKV